MGVKRGLQMLGETKSVSHRLCPKTRPSSSSASLWVMAPLGAQVWHLQGGAESLSGSHMSVPQFLPWSHGVSDTTDRVNVWRVGGHMKSPSTGWV